jgi:hypothetical protein
VILIPSHVKNDADEYQIGPVVGTVGPEKTRVLPECQRSGPYGYIALAWRLTRRVAANYVMAAYGAPACRKQRVHGLESRARCDD